MSRIYCHWNESLELLKNWLINHNGIYPKRNEINESGFAIGEWCRQQRRLYKEGRLLNEKTDKLNSIQFQWYVQQNNKEAQFMGLLKFVENHYRLPKRHEEFPVGNKIGEWLHNIQKSTKAYSNIHFKIDNKWFSKGMKIIIEAQENKENETIAKPNLWFNKALKVMVYMLVNKKWPVATKNHAVLIKNLGYWCTRQRQKHKINELSNWQQRAIEHFGLSVKVNYTWEEQFSLLQEYANKNNKFPGATIIYPNQNKLGEWCNHQRFLYQKSLLDKKRQIKLVSIKFPWNYSSYKWDMNYNALKVWLKKNNGKLPPKGNYLFAWKEYHKNNKKLIRLINQF